MHAEAQLSNEVTAIREAFRSQAEKWRLVPRLALEADGRGGWSQQNMMAYMHGYWDVGGDFLVLIDLYNGEIVSFPFPRVGTMAPMPVSDGFLTDVMAQLRRLNVDEVLAQLREAATKPPHQPDMHAKNLAYVIGRSGLGEVFAESNRIGLPKFSVIF